MLLMKKTVIPSAPVHTPYWWIFLCKLPSSLQFFFLIVPCVMNNDTVIDMVICDEFSQPVSLLIAIWDLFGKMRPSSHTAGKIGSSGVCALANCCAVLGRWECLIPMHAEIYILIGLVRLPRGMEKVDENLEYSWTNTKTIDSELHKTDEPRHCPLTYAPTWHPPHVCMLVRQWLFRWRFGWYTHRWCETLPQCIVRA